MRKVKENKETGILLRRRPGKASEELPCHLVKQGAEPRWQLGGRCGAF